MKKQKIVYRFLIELQNVEPCVWRIIEVPESQSFFDLHVAIQDAMGWTDSHLHAFRPMLRGRQIEASIGFPTQSDFDDTLAGWETAIEQHFSMLGQEMIYEYDFGDSWLHRIVLTGMLLAEKGVKYPRCLSGERACPPEDCGGFPGYDNILQIIQNPDDEEYEDCVAWLGEDFDPGHFDATEVKFHNAKARLKRWLAVIS